ncbi:hypothetical protein YB2330_006116 [Saitoella coloradoensis]
MFQHSTSHQASGIVNGTVPKSIRPDGSVRKEIKIRPGYTPPEDVTRYTRKPNLPPLPPGAAAAVVEEKKKKRSRGKGKGKNTPPAKVEHQEEDTEKRARSLRKKIRQATDLKAKKDAGHPLLPEQEDKLSQLERLEEELSSLSL